MARIRTIKPEFWNDEKLAQQPESVMLTCIGILTFSDDYGVVKANALWLKNQIYPYKDKLRLEVFSTWLVCLEKIDVVIPITYRGEKFYYIRTFRKHQKIDRPSKARNIKEDQLVFLLMQKDYYLQPDGDCVKHSTSPRRILDEPSSMEEEKEIVSSKGGEAAHEESGTGDLRQDEQQEQKKPPDSAPPPKPEVVTMPEGFSPEFEQMWGKWKQYKLDTFKFKYKNVTTEQAAINSLVKIGVTEENCNYIIVYAIGRQWEGLYLPDDLKNKNKGQYGQSKQTGGIQTGSTLNADYKQNVLNRMGANGGNGFTGTDGNTV